MDYRKQWIFYAPTFCKKKITFLMYPLANVTIYLERELAPLDPLLCQRSAQQVCHLPLSSPHKQRPRFLNISVDVRRPQLQNNIPINIDMELNLAWAL